MGNKSSILIDIDDPRSTIIAEVISNKTSKKILSTLTEKEMSESDIATKLGLPLNTIGYNMKKLVASGLVEETKRLFWSAKGKRMKLYKLSNKRIVITPKSMIKGVLPALAITALTALGISTLLDNTLQTQKNIELPLRTISEQAPSATEKIIQGSSSAAQMAGTTSDTAAQGVISGVAPVAETNALVEIVTITVTHATHYWAWFLLGALTATLIVLLWNWKRL